jgi:hypothetical protein
MGNTNSKTDNLLMDGTKKILNNHGEIIASYNYVIENIDPKKHPVYTFCFSSINNDEITSIYCFHTDDKTPYSIKIVIPINLKMNILKQIFSYFFINITNFSFIKSNGDVSKDDIINMKDDLIIDFEKIILNYESLNLDVYICECGLCNIDRESCFNNCDKNSMQYSLIRNCMNYCEHPFNSAQTCNYCKYCK